MITNSLTPAERALWLFKSLTAESHVRQSLASLVRLAAWSSDAPMAGVIATLPNRIEMLATQGLAMSAVATQWSFTDAGYSPDAIFVAPDTHKHPYLRENAIVRDAPKVRALMRFPVRSADLPFVVALAVADVRARDEGNWPSRKARQMLEEIASIVENEVSIACDIARASDGDSATDPLLEELVETVERSPNPILLLDEELRLLVLNAPMSALLGVPRDAALGRTLPDLDVPSGAALARLSRWSLDGREPIADIAFALSREELSAGATGATMSISAYPLSVRDHESQVMLIRGADVSRPLKGADRLEAMIPPPDPAPDLGELGPTSTFLTETLVARTAVRARGGMSYVTLRTWRGAIKEYQIKALRALKARPPAPFVEAIAQEMEDAVKRIIGRAAFGAVVAMPCGRSSAGQCLSSRIAERLAGRLNLKLVAALESERRPGASHPRDNARRPPMRLVEPVPVPVLLVDDVATSGRHLQEATALLQPGSGAVFSIAWIGGES